MEEFKVGDIVRCKPGFNNNSNYVNEFSGGAGYKEGLEFIVGSISICSKNKKVYWIAGKSQGVFEHTLELVPQEIEIILW